MSNRLLFVTQEMEPFTVLSEISSVVRQLAPAMKDKGMDIERPGQRSSGQVKKESLLITITAAGALRASGDEISMNNLRGYVSSYLKKLPVPVVIMADKKAPVGLLAEVMDECRLAGARNISLATEDKK